MNKQRLLRVVLTLILFCTNVGLYAYDFESDGIYYNLNHNDKTAAVTSKGNEEKYTDIIVIPESINYNGETYSVTRIGDSAFSNCSGLTSITIPNSVTSVGYRGFSGCTGLTSITIPNSVTSIDGYAFDSCYSMTSITIPSSVTSIGEGTFSQCRSLISVTIPNSVTSIGGFAFGGCSGLTSITIPNSVTSIGWRAFSECSGLTSITIPNSVTSIGSEAFAYCSSLTLITIPNSVTTIGSGAFYGCIGLTSITIPNSVTSIGSYAFSECSGLASIAVSSGNTKYDSRNNCNAVIETSSNTLITGCKDTIIPNSVTTIGSGAFYGCIGLTSIMIPNSVTCISWNAFEYCSGLTSITIPNSVTRINGSAFSACTSLTSVISEIQNPFNIDVSVFDRISSNAILQVPMGTKSKYVALSGWKRHFKEIVEAEDSRNYDLTISSSGNGSVSYNGTSIRGGSQSFNVNEGTNATVTFTPDSEYLVARVKVNNTDVTSSVSNNQYVISNIIQDTSLEVEFEKKSSDYDITQHIFVYNIGGSVTQTNDLINSGSQLNWTFSNDSEYSVTFKSMQLIDGKTGVEGNVMTVDKVVEAGTSVSYSTTIGASGIHIPVTCRFRYVFNGNEYYTDAVYSGNPDNFTLSIKSTGNGEVSYDGKTIRNSSEAFSVRMMSSPTLSFTPDNGCCVKSLLVNNKDVTSNISNNRYTIDRVMSNTSVEVVFEEIMDALTVDGVNYSVTSQSNRTITVVGGTYEQVLIVPKTLVWKGSTWTVIGIDNDALKNSKGLAAVIWNPEAAFTATVTNPNLLLYVTKEEYAPLSVQNVVVNGTASNIVLKEATSGNNFYCPQSFVAQKISFTHNYQMQTGIGESRGWETIALPFDVQSITHQTAGAIKPFAKWKSGDSEKPFWLYELTGMGWNEADGIKAYTPYIISMPNNSQYDSQWILKGSVTFAASNVTVDKTENVNMPSYRERTFVPCYANQEASTDIYALNVKNDYVTNSSNMAEGSWFVQNLRQVHPFEAYMTSSSQAQEFFGVLETSIETIDSSQEAINRFYDLQGRMVQGSKLPKGIYIMNGKKMLIK